MPNAVHVTFELEQQGGVDSLKTLEILQKKDKILTDLIIMVDDMYFQKAAQYQARRIRRSR